MRQHKLGGGVVNRIYHGFENNQYTVGIFIDLKKAFDTVGHKIVIDKLKFYGIHGIQLTCFLTT